MHRGADCFVEPEYATSEKMPSAANNDQKKRSRPYPSGWVSSGGRTLLSTPMSKNTRTATSAALAAVWARRATEPVTPAATASPSVSAQFTASETTTLRRVVPPLVVSAIPGTRSVLLGLRQLAVNPSRSRLVAAIVAALRLLSRGGDVAEASS